jgi:hypothetical protein
MRQLRRNEAGLLHRATAAAKEDRDALGIRRLDPTGMDKDRSLFTAVADPLEAPEVFQLRRMILSWRFYDSFRTDRQASARMGRIATRTPSLAADGGDLAAAVQTILEIGDRDAFQTAIADAFPGCRLSVDITAPLFRLQLHQPGLLRPLDATELSDGTLRYLLWRPPPAPRCCSAKRCWSGPPGAGRPEPILWNESTSHPQFSGPNRQHSKPTAAKGCSPGMTAAAPCGCPGRCCAGPGAAGISESDRQ